MPTPKEMSYDKLLLDALRVVSYRPGSRPLTNEDLTKAMTLNENLMTLGWTLAPTDLLKIAVSPDVDEFYEKVSGLMSSVEAKPMYPDFPNQVMKMSEAQFRMHQMIHYFSTYGMEALFGQEVSKGWLPAEAGLVSDTEKVREDDTLLKAEPLGLIEEKDVFTVPFENILAKRERMTDMEREIVKRCVELGQIDFSEKRSIPFKENIQDVFYIIASAGASGEIDRKDAAQALFNICQHPGDVTENIHKYLTKHRYHLRTTEKKMFVDLYEKYSVQALRENVSVSKKNKHFTKEIFNRIDFLKYAHSEEMKQAVKDIDILNSWEGRARKKIQEHAPDALRFVGARPGMLIRMTSFALRNGYSEQDILNELIKGSRAVSVQTLVSQINQARQEQSIEPKGYKNQKSKLQKQEMWALGTRNKKIAENVQNKIDRLTESERRRSDSKSENSQAVSRIFTGLLRERLAQIETGLAGKKLYLDESVYDMSRMTADPSKKTAEQGYLPSATVVKIPDGVERVRCFTYWDDPTRIDIDLHIMGVDKSGKMVHIGWNGDFKDSGAVFSGDITHSNAAEYIDVDLKNTDIQSVAMDVVSFTGVHFPKIEKCFAGMMAVKELGENVKLYDPKNCFFSSDITADTNKVEYGVLDVPSRTLKYLGQELSMEERMAFLDGQTSGTPKFSVKEYLSMLAEAQNAVLVDSPEEADVVLTLTKPGNEKEVSLIDNNFFYDTPIAEPQELIIEPAEIAAESRSEGKAPQEKINLQDRLAELASQTNGHNEKTEKKQDKKQDTPVL